MQYGRQSSNCSIRFLWGEWRKAGVVWVVRQHPVMTLSVEGISGNLFGSSNHTQQIYETLKGRLCQECLRGGKNEYSSQIDEQFTTQGSVVQLTLCGSVCFGCVQSVQVGPFQTPFWAFLLFPALPQLLLHELCVTTAARR